MSKMDTICGRWTSCGQPSLRRSGKPCSSPWQSSLTVASSREVFKMQSDTAKSASPSSPTGVSSVVPLEVCFILGSSVMSSFQNKVLLHSKDTNTWTSPIGFNMLFYSDSGFDVITLFSFFNIILEIFRGFLSKVEVIFKISEVNFGILVEVICQLQNHRAALFVPSMIKTSKRNNSCSV